MQVSIVGLDIAKQVVQFHGVDANGKIVLRKRLRRNQVLDFFANLPRCLVGIEACGGAHYWARAIGTFGHTVRLMSPKFVKPYVKSGKNDRGDAEGICEGVSRPSMRFVPAKSVEQQDLQALHRVRSRLITSRTQLSNQIRGLLAEYGIVLPLRISQLRSLLPSLISEESSEFTPFGRSLFASLYEELIAIEERIESLENRLSGIHRANPLCQRIAEVGGIGPVTTTAVIAAISDGKVFRNGRQFAAWLGLAPRQYSSGERQRLMLIHGARSVVFRSGLKTDRRSQWIADKQRRLGTAKASVAVANKNARIIWALLAHDEAYRAAA
jgi:transposase